MSHESSTRSGSSGDMPATTARGAWWSWARRAVLVIGIVCALVVIRRSGFPTDADEVRVALSGLGPWMTLGLLGIFVLRPMLLLPITPLWIGAGTLFGWIEGTLFAAVGTSLGAALGFAVARRLGRRFVEARLGSRLPRWTRMSADGGLRTVLALQLTPIMPHDLITGMAAASGMPYRAFAVGSLLGTLPIIAVYAYVGQAMWAIPSPEFWSAVAVLTTMTVLMLAWNRRQARRREATLSARWLSSHGVER